MCQRDDEEDLHDGLALSDQLLEGLELADDLHNPVAGVCHG